MKVLILSHLYPDNHNAQFGIFIKREIDALGKYCDIKVVSLRPWVPGRGAYMPAEKETNYDTYYPFYMPLPGVLFNPIKGFWFFLFLWGVVAKIKREFDFDLIHAHRVYPDGFAAVLLGKLFHRPVVVSARGSDINVLSQRAILKQFIQYVIRHTSKIIAVSKTLAEKIISLGAGADKIFVMPKGVDTDMFSPRDKQETRRQLGLPQDKIIVLYVGNLVAIKNPQGLIDAARAIPEDDRNDYLFVMIGDGELRGSISERIENERLSPFFKVTGRLDPEEIPFWMNAADMLVLPSLNEGMPNVLYEAMASGLPVIASRVGGIPEIIEEGKTGYLVDSRDALQIKERIIQYNINRELFERVSIEGRRCIQDQQLDWDANSQKIVAMYQALFN